MFLYFAVHTCFHEENFGFVNPFGTRICKPVSLHPECFEFLYRARGDLFQLCTLISVSIPVACHSTLLVRAKAGFDSPTESHKERLIFSLHP